MTQDKRARAEYMRDYYTKHKADILDKKRKAYADNKNGMRDTMRQRAKDRYVERRDEIREKANTRYATDEEYRESRKALARAYQRKQRAFIQFCKEELGFSTEEVNV